MEVYKKYHFVIFTFFFRIERKYRCKVIEPDSDAVELSDDVNKNYSNNEKQTIVTKIHQVTPTFSKRKRRSSRKSTE